MKVTFAVPEDGMNGEAVAVVGDTTGIPPPPRRGPEGAIRVTSLTLPAGERYAFRYLAEGGRWFNDEDAQDQANGFGGDDCVLDLRDLG